MSETYALTATKRESTKHSARDARQSGSVPGIVYGHGFDPTPVSVDYSELLRTYRKTGTAAIIDLDIEGKKAKVLIHQLDVHPVRGELYHVDFQVLNLKEVTTVHVPLNFVGESPAVKNHGGTFIANHSGIDIRCLPTDIPHDIEIDISALVEMHDHISVKDLGLDPEKFEIMGIDEETVLCSVAGRSATEEDEPSETPETEVEGEESAEEGGEDAAKEEGGE